MLDPWIIEEIRKREEERRREAERPRIEMPCELPHHPPEREGKPPEDDADKKRGVVIIDL